MKIKPVRALLIEDDLYIAQLIRQMLDKVRDISFDLVHADWCTVLRLNLYLRLTRRSIRPKRKEETALDIIRIIDERPKDVTMFVTSCLILDTR